MSRINSSDQLAALIRSNLGTLRSNLQRGVSKKDDSRRAPATASRSRDNIAVLAAERVRSISPDDPQRSDKAIRVFLECVLLGELGEELVTDPAFGRMVDHVQEQLRSDPQLLAATSELAAALLAGGAAKA